MRFRVGSVGTAILNYSNDRLNHTFDQYMMSRFQLRVASAGSNLSLAIRNRLGRRRAGRGQFGSGTLTGTATVAVQPGTPPRQRHALA